jgi:DNA-binding transcriptional LysR family regulator
VELAIVQDPSESCMADLFTEHFATDTLDFFAHPGHPVSKKVKISLAELANTPLIVIEGWEPTRKFFALAKSRGLTLNVGLRCASPDAVKAAVRQKIGIGILFHDLIADDVRRKESKILRIQGLRRMTGNSYIVLNNPSNLKPLGTEFLALLCEMKRSQKKCVELRSQTGT